MFIKTLLIYTLSIHSVQASYFELADSYKNFSSSQDFNGWNYGYYQNSNPRSSFTFYGGASSGNDVHPYSWKIDGNYCQINKDAFHPATGTAGSCSSTSFGKCRPSLLWNIPSRFTAYNPYQIKLVSNAYGTCGDGVNVKMYVNDDLTFSQTAGFGKLRVDILLDFETINTVELVQDGMNNCNCDTTRYVLTIFGTAPSPSVTPSSSLSPSVSPTSSVTVSLSATRSLSPSVTTTISLTSSISPSISATVSSSISSSPSITASSTISITPSKTVSVSVTPSISVTSSSSVTKSISPSKTSSMSMSKTLTPSKSFSSSLTPTRSISASLSPSRSITATRSITRSVTRSITASSSSSPSVTSSESSSPSSSASVSSSPDPSYIIPEEPSYVTPEEPSYAPIIEELVSESPSVSTTQTQSVSITPSFSPSRSFSSSLTPSQSRTPSDLYSSVNTYNCYNHNGITISSVSYIRTNPSGNYVDNMNCNFKIVVPIGYIPKISYVSFSTELGFDFWKIYDGATTSSRLISSTSGNVMPSISYGSNREMYITWTTDISVISTGVVAYLDFVIPASTSPTSSITPSGSRTNSITPSNSYSPTRSVTMSLSPTMTLSSSSSGSRTISSTKSLSVSPTKTVTPSLTSSVSGTRSLTNSPSISNTVTSTISRSSSVTKTSSVSISASLTGTKTVSQTISISPSLTKTNTISPSLTMSITITPSPSPYHIFTCDDSETIRTSIDYKSYISTNLYDLYKVNMSCNFIVIAPREYAVKLSYLRFNTESNYDFWSIYDGYDYENKMIQKVSGPSIPKQSIVYSSGRIMTILWNSDESIVETGIEALVDFIVASPSPSGSATMSLSPSSSATMSLSSTSSATMSLSPSGSATMSLSPSGSATMSLSSTSSATVSLSQTQTISSSVSPSLSSTSTVSKSVSITPTSSISPSITVSPSSSITSSTSITSSSSVTSSTSITPSTSVTASSSITPSTSVTASSSITPTSSVTSSTSITSSSSLTPSTSVTSSSTVTPSTSITTTISISPSTTVTPSTSISPSSTNTPSTTVTPSSTISPSSTNTPSSTKTPSSTISPSGSITSSLTPTPSSTKTPSITGTVSVTISSSISVTLSATVTYSSSVSISSTTSSSVSPSVSVSSSVTTSPSISPSRTASTTSRATNSPIPVIVLPSRPPKPENVSENFIKEITIPITEILSSFNFTNALANSKIPVLMSYESELGQVLLQAQPIGIPYSFDFSSLNSDPTFIAPSIAIPASDTPKIVEVSLVTADAFLALLPESAQENLTSSILSISQYNLDGTPLTVTSAFNFTLPMSGISGENNTAQCIYLDRTSGNWSSEGCVSYDYSGDGYVLCSCSHMTEFASRFAAIAEMNNAIFEILAQQLQKPFIWLVVGGILSVFGILSFISFRLDEKSYYHYLYNLESNPEIQFIQTHYNDYILHSPIMSESLLQKVKSQINTLKSTRTTYNLQDENSVNISRGFWTYLKICSRRIPYKHPYFTWIFAFDPLFPRSYRLMFLFVGLVTSLFTTALLYGYKAGNINSETQMPPLEFKETVVLSLMTSAINIPIMKILKFMIDYSSKLEYKFRFPRLYEELQNRMNFEKHIHNRPLRSGNNKSEDVSLNEDIDYIKILNKISIIPNFDNLEIFKKNLSSIYSFSSVKSLKLELPNIDVSPKKVHSIHKFLVLHSKASIATLAIIFTWFAWCLFFFISFGLYQKQESVNSLLQTFGQTQGAQIFVIQPLSLMIILWILNKIESVRIKYCHKKESNSFIEVSNPMKNKYSTMLSNSFGHLLYVHIPAKCSQMLFPKLFNNSKIPVDLILAPNKAVSEFIHHHNNIENVYSSREMSILSLYYIEKLI